MAWGSITRAAFVAMLALAAGSTTDAHASAGVGDGWPKNLPADDRHSRIETTAGGDALVVWTRASAGRSVIVAAWKKRGRSWGRSRVLSATPSAVQLADVSLGEGGFAQVLWGKVSGATAQLFVSEFTGPRRGWARPKRLGDALADGTGLARIQGSVADHGRGAATAAWCDGGNMDNLRGPPGQLKVASSQVGGTWSSPATIWTGTPCSEPDLQANRAGAALLRWSDYPADVGGSRSHLAVRSNSGRWSEPLPPRLLGQFFDSEQTTLAADGAVYAVGSLGYRTITSAPPVWAGVPTGSSPAFLGGGPLEWKARLASGGPGTLALLGEESPTRSPSGYGAPVLRFALKDDQNRWSVEFPDAFAEAPAASSPAVVMESSLARRPSGAYVVSWAERLPGSGCAVGVFQVERSSGGRWQPRVLAGKFHARGCGDWENNLGTSKAASLWWARTREGLRVHALTTGASAARPRLALRTKTWSEIRRAGAIVFLCRLSTPGTCRISLLAASRTRNIREALELFCRPETAIAEVVRAGDDVELRLPLAPGCYDGGPLPALPRSVVDVPVFAVSDVEGAQSRSLRSTVRISP